MTGLTTVFTFQYARSFSSSAPCAVDPYFLPLRYDELDVLASTANLQDSRRSSGISALTLKAVKYESLHDSIPSVLGQIYLENGVAFYQLSLLTNDLTLWQCLYVEIPKELKVEVCPPNTIHRLEIAKTPAEVIDDFIVPNGYPDQDYKDSPHIPTANEESDTESQAIFAVLDEDPRTIVFEWLNNETDGTLTRVSATTAFHENLDVLLDEIEDAIASNVPKMETLYVKSHDTK